MTHLLQLTMTIPLLLDSMTPFSTNAKWLLVMLLSTCTTDATQTFNLAELMPQTLSCYLANKPLPSPTYLISSWDPTLHITDAPVACIPHKSPSGLNYCVAKSSHYDRIHCHKTLTPSRRYWTCTATSGSVGSTLLSLSPQNSNNSTTMAFFSIHFPSPTATVTVKNGQLVFSLSGHVNL